MSFFGIGLPELFVILVLTLIVVGPQRLPEVAAQLGRTIREFRRYSSGAMKELMDSVQDLQREYQELRSELDVVGGDLREKAQAFGRELMDVSEDAKQKLQEGVYSPEGQPAPIALPAGTESPKEPSEAATKPDTPEPSHVNLLPAGLACGFCGTSNIKGAAFCSACGQRLDGNEDAENTCPNCGALNSTNNKFCTSCGSALLKASIS
jgi:sec-independent protein translocase protein TatB